MRTLGGLRGKAIVVMALFTMIPILAMVLLVIVLVITKIQMAPANRLDDWGE